MNNLRRVNRFCGVGLRNSGVSILVINLQHRSVWRVTNHMLPCFLHRSQIKGNAWNAFWRFAHDLTLHWTRSDVLELRSSLRLASISFITLSTNIYAVSITMSMIPINVFFWLCGCWSHHTKTSFPLLCLSSMRNFFIVRPLKYLLCISDEREGRWILVTK